MPTGALDASTNASEKSLIDAISAAGYEASASQFRV